MLEKIFKLQQNNTTVHTEIRAGITTFMTMGYILIVNPNILSVAGMDKGALLTATALSAAIATLIMAFFANYPFALAPGMGLNIYFVYTVVIHYGFTWQMALAAVFIEGIIFIFLAVSNIRDAFFNGVPYNLKIAVSVGIGLLITFIGLQSAGLVIYNSGTMVSLGDIRSVETILAFIGVLVTIFLMINKVKGAILIGILITYALGIMCHLAFLYEEEIIPTSIFSLPHSIRPILFQLDFSKILTGDFIVVVVSFFIIDLFDTLGTLIGISTKAGFLDRQDKLPRLKQTLLADAVGTVSGAALGTSTVTTYVESITGIAAGGRTGLTSFVTGMLFLLALLFTPILASIPAFATAPALIVVGLFMVEGVGRINFSDYTESFPAFITIVMIPLSYSITDGLTFGVLSYCILKAISGRIKELNLVILSMGILFAIKLFFL